MRAIVCRELGPPESLTVEDVDEPEAGPAQVIVDVAACAVNFPDLLMIQGLYQFKPPMPFTPGGEIAGTVSAVGADVDVVAVGDRVIAPTTHGGLAERVVVGAGSCIAVPDGLDIVGASALMYAHGTSHHALKDRAALRPGEHLLVLGAAGGVGLAAVELGALMGAHVIAAASSPEKLELCRRRGAEMVIDYSQEDVKARTRELTHGHGADVVYDAVGGQFAEAALRATAINGRFLVIGFASGEIPRIALNLPLLKECSIVGVFWGQFVSREPERHAANIAELVDWWRSGKIAPHVSATYPLERAALAFRALADRTAQGKVVVVLEPS